MYSYKVKDIARMVDGDTFDLDIDLGFYAVIRIRVRLVGIDTLEIFGRNAHELGVPARDAAEGWMRERLENQTLGIETYADKPNTPLPQGGFGRWAGVIFDMSNGDTLADFLRSEGYDKDYPRIN